MAVNTAESSAIRSAPAALTAGGLATAPPIAMSAPRGSNASLVEFLPRRLPRSSLGGEGPSVVGPGGLTVAGRTLVGLQRGSGEPHKVSG